MGCGTSRPANIVAAAPSMKSVPAPTQPGAASRVKDIPNRLVVDKDSWTATKHTTAVLASLYDMQDELGRGGFGAVSKAQRKSDGKIVAVKSVSRPDARVLQEAKVWETISTPYHEGILQLVEVMHSNDDLHLFMEVMPYGELMDALDHIAFSEQACRMVTVQIASALAHLHLRHHVAHCDVKPANVLCCSPDPTQLGSLKLADYGFCQHFKSRSRPSFTTACGTLDYWAPELAANYRNTRASTGLVVPYGPGVDVWALGAMVYELLHGDPPYFAATDDELQLDLIEKHELHFPPESFGAASAQGKDLVSRLLTGDWRERPHIEDVLRHDWLQPLQDEALREQLQSPLDESVHGRRNARLRGRLRGRVSALKLIAVRRLSDPFVTPDTLRNALQASSLASSRRSSKSNASPAAKGSSKGASRRASDVEAPAAPPVEIVPPSTSALAAHLEMQHTEHAPRGRRELSDDELTLSPEARRRMSGASQASAVSYESELMGAREI